MTALTVPITDWHREPDADDLALVAHCEGPTIDIGCGPGRLTQALALAGHVVLGIDVAPEAVLLTRRRGAAALRRDIDQPLPGEGRWETALLADGNLGIGGDPVALLRRVRRLLTPGGRVVAELAAPGVPVRRSTLVLEWGPARGAPLPWSVVGVDDIGDLAAAAGWRLAGIHPIGARWCAVLEEAR